MKKGSKPSNKFSLESFGFSKRLIGSQGISFSSIFIFFSEKFAFVNW